MKKRLKFPRECILFEERCTQNVRHTLNYEIILCPPFQAEHSIDRTVGVDYRRTSHCYICGFHLRIFLKLCEGKLTECQEIALEL